MREIFLRVGTEYYKQVDQPLLSGDSLKTLVKWKKAEIKQDYGADFINAIPKYDGFCLIPSHQDYKKEVGKFYNKYEPLSHTICNGEFNHITKFLKHIFGLQYALALDYLTILWRYPTQILPILCLVSEERKTGKTTFLNFLKLIFKGNMTINKNEDFRSRFNSDWSGKIIIAVDEVLLDKREDSERIKNLSTASTYKTESKGLDKIETEFFGKFILCSNNEDNFIQVDEREIRYWVVKVPPILDEEENVDLLDVFRQELPYFLFHLNNRKIVHERKTRMWFTKSEIETEALLRLKKSNRTSIYKEIVEILEEEFCKHNVTELMFTSGEIMEKLLANNVRCSNNRVAKILEDEFKLIRKNTSYKYYYLCKFPYNNQLGSNYEIRRGKCFVFPKEKFVE